MSLYLKWLGVIQTPILLYLRQLRDYSGWLARGDEHDCPALNKVFNQVDTLTIWHER